MTAGIDAERLAYDHDTGKTGHRDGPSPNRGLERVLTRICRACKAAFEPTRPHQRYCRPSCRMAAFKARVQAGDSDGDTVAGLFE